MVNLLSKASWWRIFAACLATYATSLVLTVAGIFVYTLLTAWKGASSEAYLEWLSVGLGTWSVPVLTFFTAAWAAHETTTEISLEPIS